MNRHFASATRAWGLVTRAWGPGRLPDGSDRIKNLDFIHISTTVILGDS